ncbi:MAG: hypothetical protein EA397_19010 [Deltaproteobacteria bacterium]|nr:MAG: hypothetical protein EA397_19010 [Deltaproteobacteria bacterium]
MMRLGRELVVVGLAVSLGLGAIAADKKKGRPVTIRVVDQEGQALPNATVRVPGTEGKRLVNRNGEWTESMLYTHEGDEFVFQKNEFVEFHIAAPEFHARSIRYRVRGRMNYVQVVLKPMPPPTAPLAEDEGDDLMIRWFQRTEAEEAEGDVEVKK